MSGPISATVPCRSCDAQASVSSAMLQLATLGGFGSRALADSVLIGVGELRDREGRKLEQWV